MPIVSGHPGQRIQDLMKNKKITQSRLAENLGISAASMSRYINGESEIPHSVLLKIALYFGTATDFLLGLTDVPYRTNYDIDRLGLTEDAARNLLAKRVDINAVNWLLTQKDFIELTKQIAEFKEGTEAIGLASINKMMGALGKILQKQARAWPEDKKAASMALQDVKDNMMEPTLPQMVL
ncbi:MAG: helix-turn-helix domain-containing protein, partial [Faecousia sp.]